MDDTSQKERKKKHSTFLPFSTVLKVRTVTKFKIKKLIDDGKAWNVSENSGNLISAIVV